MSRQVRCIELKVHILFGWTTNFALPFTGAKYSPAKFMWSVLDHFRYACISSTRASLERANPSTAKTKVIFLDSARARITAATRTEEAQRYYPRIFPSKSDTPAPSVCLRIVFLQMPHPSSSSPSLHAIRLPSNPSSNANRRLFPSVGSTSRHLGGTPSSLSSLLFWLAGVPEVDDLQPYRLLGFGESMFIGMTFLGRGKELYNRKRSGFWWTLERRYGHAGRWVVLEKLEWSGSLDVKAMSGRAPDNAERIDAI